MCLSDMAVTSGNKNTIRSVPVNKTGSSPKREMQPWLLTDYARQTTHAPPASTEGMVVIVSDWLTERKTTPNDVNTGRLAHELKSTGYDVTERLAATSQLSTESIQYESHKPLDEVIFTRIGLPKQDGTNMAPSENMVSNLISETEITDVPTKPTAYTGTNSELSLNYNIPNVTNVDSIVNKLDHSLNNVFHPNIDEMKKTTLSELYTNEYPPTEINKVVDTDKEDLLTTEFINKSTLQPIRQTMNEKDIQSADDAKSGEQVKNNSNGAQMTSGVGSFNFFYPEDIQKPESETTSPVSMLKNAGEVESYNQTDEDALNSYNERLMSSPEQLDYTTTMANVVLLENQHPTIRLEDLSPSMSKPDMNSQNHRSDTAYTTDQSIKTEVTAGVTEVSTPYIKGDQVNIGTQDDVRKVLASVDQSINTSKESGEILTHSNLNKSDTQSTPNGSIVEVLPSVEAINSSSKLNSSIYILSQEEAQFDNRELSQKSTIMPDFSEIASTVGSTQVISQPQRQEDKFYKPAVKEGNKSDGITIDENKSNLSNENWKVRAELPPVLNLNSHVPFLVIGGDDGSDESDSKEDDSDMVTPTTDFRYVEGSTHMYQSIDLTTLSDAEQLKGDKLANYGIPTNLNKSNNYTSVKTEDNSSVPKSPSTALSTPHIPLTPGDLKALAEHMINETIKPVDTSKDQEYIANSWLQGNLTSEEKVASIMAAANVSIAFINQTRHVQEDITTAATTSTVLGDKERITEEKTSAPDNLQKTIDKVAKINVEKNTRKELDVKENVVELDVLRTSVNNSSHLPDDAKTKIAKIDKLEPTKKRKPTIDSNKPLQDEPSYNSNPDISTRAHVRPNDTSDKVNTSAESKSGCDKGKVASAERETNTVLGDQHVFNTEKVCQSEVPEFVSDNTIKEETTTADLAESRSNAP